MTRYFKQWYENRADAMAIENCIAYREWQTNKFYKNIKTMEKSHLILGDNRKIFRKLFGPPDSHWKSEFRFSVWIQEFKGEKFILLTAKGKGTCIEICDTDFDNINDKSEAIIGYVEDLLNKIENIK